MTNYDNILENLNRVDSINLASHRMTIGVGDKDVQWTTSVIEEMGGEVYEVAPNESGVTVTFDMGDN